MDKIKKSLLKLRKKLKRKKPVFKRQEWYSQSLLGTKWKRPRGIHSKRRQGLKARGKPPNIGYRSPSQVRGLNQSGLLEVRVFNVNDLSKLDPKKHSAVMGRTVGRKKRMDILKKASEIGLKVSNFKL